MTDPRDGKIYKTIEIANSVWMAENLNFSDTTLLKACYDDNVLFCDKYGGLYNWAEAMKACPSGWHLPTKDEFDQLMNAAGENGRDRYVQLREGGSTGMNMLLGGWVHLTWHERFWHLEKAGMYWCSIETKRPDLAFDLLISYPIKTAKMVNGDKDDSRSVRCVKDK